MTVTIEQIPRGPLPAWVFNHSIEQAIDPRNRTEGGPSRLLFLHSSSLARDRFLSTVIDKIGIIDRTNHLTLGGLTKKLFADFREPRVLPSNPALEQTIHRLMQIKAAELAFPVLHPHPDWEWPIAKTQNLLELDSVLRFQNAPLDVLEEHLSGLHTVLDIVEKQLNGTHPNRLLPRLLAALLDKNRAVFTLEHLDGIVLLDQSPTLVPIHAEILRAISSRVPIHQLCYSGSQRLGMHGWLLEDIPPVKTLDDLPEWIPPHPIGSQDPDVPLHRIHVRKNGDSPAALGRIVSQAIDSGIEDIVIVHPNGVELPRSHLDQLKALGHHSPRATIPLRGSPFVHWLAAIVGLSHGEDGFSLERILALAVQRTVRIFNPEEVESHPVWHDLSPLPDRDSLDSLARDRRLIGGAGVLGDWLRALSAETDDSVQGKRLEATQWWFLNLLGAMYPILDESDAQVLMEKSNHVGCSSGELLPFEIIEGTPDEWLDQVIGMIDHAALPSRFDGTIEDGVIGLQTLLSTVSSLRENEQAVGLNPIVEPRGWRDQIISMIESAELQNSSKPVERFILCSPQDALGCHANLVIVLDPLADNWDLRVRLPPLLSEEERQYLGILRPDGPIREARHYLSALLHAGKEVIVIDSTHIDESTPPVAPFAEWCREGRWESNPPSILSKDIGKTEGWTWETIDELDCLIAESTSVFSYPIEDPSMVVERSHGISRQENRENQGSRLLQRKDPDSNFPLSETAILARYERDLMSDRMRRQPLVINSDTVYHPETVRTRVVSTRNMAIVPMAKHRKVTLPVMNPEWPVLGGPSSTGESSSVSIDPRPISPASIQVDSMDHRMGKTAELKWSVPKVWSPSRLRVWLQCARRGWLSKALDASADDLPDDELDNRVRGNLVHEVYEGLIEGSLGMKRSVPRTNFSIPSVDRSSLSDESLMTSMAQLLDAHAPWLVRSDVVTEERLRDLVGLTEQEWRAWLVSGDDMNPAGRFARIIEAERTLSDAIPLVMEYQIGSSIEREEGQSVRSPHIELDQQEGCSTIRINGWIDRVDLIPWDVEGTLVNDSGSDSVIPLEGDPNWTPKRLVAIRDMKSAEINRKRTKHHELLFEDIQLALYARAWEIEHPGDQVIAAGVTDIGLKTEHFLEIDLDWKEHLAQFSIGQQTEDLTGIFRFPSSNPGTGKESAFRPWMSHRVEAVQRVVNAAISGYAIPNPDRFCNYCDVKSICGLSHLGGDFR